MRNNSYFLKSKFSFGPVESKSLTGHVRKKFSNVAGFALIELLVAISIFAVVITVVYTTLYTGLKAYHRTQGELRLNQEINQVLDKLSVELKNCYDAEYNVEEDKGGFVADSQNLSFFTIQNTYSQGSFKKLLARITYKFIEGTLFKKVQLDEDAFLEEGDFKEEELISDIEALSFQYLYSKEEGESEWKPEWSDKSHIPKGVKIEITRYDPKIDISVNLKRYIFLIQGQVVVQE